MKSYPALSSLVLAFGAAVLACRDAAPAGGAPAGPNFAVATDTGPGGCDAKQCHFLADGDGAQVNWFAAAAGDGGGEVVRFGSLNFSRGGARGQTETFLFFIVTECDPSFLFCTTVRGGSGLIPNEDVTGNNGKEFHLRTNTSTNPDFDTFAGPRGIVEVDWVSNGLIVQRFSGSTERSQPGFREHDVGQSTFGSANAAGSVVGLGIAAGNDAQITFNRSVTININFN